MKIQWPVSHTRLAAWIVPQKPLSQGEMNSESKGIPVRSLNAVMPNVREGKGDMKRSQTENRNPAGKRQ